MQPRPTSVTALDLLPAVIGRTLGGCVGIICPMILLMFAASVNAQSITNLHGFVDHDGFGPSGLILSGDTLYGTTSQGGSNFVGTIFKVNTDGSGFTNLFHFGATNGDAPGGNLVLSGNTLYGTTFRGGDADDDGTIFSINTDGSGFTNLFFFGRTNGSGPGSLIQSGGVLYGVTIGGGTGIVGDGTVFRINPDGSGFTNLHNFDYFGDPYGLRNPQALVRSENTLYGGANVGGLFELNLDGTGFTNLYRFSPYTFGPSNFETNSEGFSASRLIDLAGTLYGINSQGGINGGGTIFKVNTNGTGFNVIYAFSTPVYEDAISASTNHDGSAPSDLKLYGKVFYGATALSGPAGGGTLFQINTDGSGFQTLFDFNFTNGYTPGIVIPSDNMLYGTLTDSDSTGSFGIKAGSVFALTLPPPALTITHSGTNVIVTWPTNAPGFNLQFTKNVLPPISWNGVSPQSSVVNGENAVTNAISTTPTFYRLKH